MDLDHISKFKFTRHYGIIAFNHYSKFCGYVDRCIEEVIDAETLVSNLRIETSWKDAGCNRHATVVADGERRDEVGLIGADIVWLIRSKSFRGKFWSRIPKYTSAHYYEEARIAFHRGDYQEFLRLSSYIESEYADCSIFSKMRSISKRLIHNGP